MDIIGREESKADSIAREEAVGVCLVLGQLLIHWTCLASELIID